MKNIENKKRIKKPLEVLIFENEVNTDDFESYNQYPEAEKGLELLKEKRKCFNEGLPRDGFNERIIGEFMKIVAKESKIPVNITCRERYCSDLSDLAKSKDIVITDIGLEGPSYNLNITGNLDEIYQNIISGFERLYGKEWFKLNDGNHIEFTIFQDSNWLSGLIDKFCNWGPYGKKGLNEKVAGLQIAKELEEQGKRVTMYTGDLRHQPGIHYGLLNGIIRPEEFVEIYEKHKKRRRAKGSSLLIQTRKPVSINNGRIVIGTRSPYKTIKDYVDVIKIAKGYQLGNK